jgi:hypothetical protein
LPPSLCCHPCTRPRCPHPGPHCCCPRLALVVAYTLIVALISPPHCLRLTSTLPLSHHPCLLATSSPLPHCPRHPCLTIRCPHLTINVIAHTLSSSSPRHRPCLTVCCPHLTVYVVHAHPPAYIIAHISLSTSPSSPSSRHPPAQVVAHALISWPSLLPTLSPPDPCRCPRPCPHRRPDPHRLPTHALISHCRPVHVVSLLTPLLPTPLSSYPPCRPCPCLPCPPCSTVTVLTVHQ